MDYKRKRRKRGIVLVAAFIFIIIFLCEMPLWYGRVTENFKESDMELSNPDRGYYWQVESSRKEKFSRLEEEGYRLTLLTFDLQNDNEGILSLEKLQELEDALEAAQDHHIGVIFRAAYGFEDTPNEPEELEMLGEHIRQMSTVLNEYADNILCIQAGLLGAYGEWHSGRFLTRNEEKAKEARLYVLRQWEKHLEKDIEVAVRRPKYIREAQGILDNRLSFHNDAFLSTDDDMGTYDDIYSRQEELAWAEKELLLSKNGGEMPSWGENSVPQNADYEFGKIHVSYLNRSYQAEIFEEWKQRKLHNQNAEKYINNHLGYRLFVAQIQKKKNILKLPMLHGLNTFKIEIVNSGYAPLDSEYKLYIVTETKQGRNVKEIKQKDLYSICNGETTMLKVDLDIVGGKFEGDSVRVGIKVAKMSESGEKESVRLANEEFSWEDGVNWIF